MTATRRSRQGCAELEDHEEIRQLLLEYARRLDAADYAGYAELFTTDGELERAARRGRTGREAIVEPAGASGSGPTPSAAAQAAFHLVANPNIQLDGDRATSTVIWAYVTHDDERLSDHPPARPLRDVLAREDGVWRFRRRDISRDLGCSPLDVPAAGRG